MDAFVEAASTYMGGPSERKVLRKRNKKEASGNGENE